MRAFQALKLTVCTVAFCCTAAHAAGALEINQDCALAGCFAGDSAGYPITISQPGSYVLTSDLAAPGSIGTDSIDVLTSPVEIDLNAHTVNGGATCTGVPISGCTGANGGVGIALSNGGAPGVFHISGGTIRGFLSSGIKMVDAGDGTVIEHLSVTDNVNTVAVSIDGATASNAVRVRDVQLSRNNGYGLAASVLGARVILENSTLGGNKYGGASMTAGSVSFGNRFTDNGIEGLLCNASCALGQNVFIGNNGGGANPQWSITTVRDMGGNVCMDDGVCP